MRILRRRAGRGLDLRGRIPAFLLGFLATSFQIYLLREFNAVFFGNELNLGFVLGAWLLWGGLGSLGRPRRGLRETAPARLYVPAIGLFYAALVLLRFSHRLMGLPAGQATGLTTSLFFSLAVGLLVSFPLGAAFVLNSLRSPGGAPQVYVLESLGAAVGGLGVHFLLVPRFSNWQGAAIVSVLAAAALLFAPARKRPWGLVASVLAASAVFAGLDFPSQKAAWRPLDLVRSEDSPYGRLQVVRIGGQTSLYNNGLPLSTYPDAEAAEESVHFALLQRPGPKRVLLVGGGAGGALGEILKYTGTRVDYVELDPALIRLAEELLPPPVRADLRNPRVVVHLDDGRAFLERSGTSFDAVILDLPEPATTQINRFYTLEFFRTVRGRLNPGGVLSFTVPSDENYIGPGLQRLLGSLLTTLELAFPRVAVVPGARNVFLASDGPLSIDAQRLSEAVTGLGLRTSYVSPAMLPSLLNPLRAGYLAGKLRAAAGEAGAVNRDLAPVSTYYHSVFWAGQFGGPESRILGGLARIPPFWVLDFPLILAAPLLGLAAFRKGPARYRFLVPVAVMGFTSIIAEMAVLVSFQASFGCVYGRISLLLTSFMAGLFGGSAAARRRKRTRPVEMAAVEAGFALILAAAGFGGRGPFPEAAPFLALFAFGVLGGWLFIAANRLFLGRAGHPGAGYAIDLIGSFLGVTLASSFVIPLLGIPALLSRLAVLNGLAMLFAAVLAFRGGPEPSA